MKTLKTKTKVTMIALILMLTIAFPFFALPTNAHTPAWTKASWTYIAVTPSPVGVGQDTLIVFWLDTLPQTGSGQYGDRFTFTVEVTKPDDSKQTLGPFTSDPVGGGWTNYIPEQEGTYTFVAKFPGIKYTGANPPPGGYTTGYGAYINDTLLASTSDPVTVVVQQDPIAGYTGNPLPTDYWTRPIYGVSREWAQIAGNWLGGKTFNPYTTAPSTAHIVWTKPTEFGGIVGEPYGDISYHTGSAYETMWTAGIIIGGRLYYNEPKAPRYGWYCVDLRTGEQIFYNNGTGPIQVGSQTGAHIGNTNIPYTFPVLSFGQIVNYDSPNQHGATAYLWSTYADTFGSTYSYTMQNGSSYSFSAPAGSTVWQMYDAFNGKWICNIANVPSGTRVTGPNGELLIYTYNSANGWLSLWNSTHVLEFPNNNLGVPYSAYLSGEAFYWMWREPIGRTVNGINGYSWNVTAPKNLGSIREVLSDRIIGQSGMTSYGASAYSIWALSLKSGTEGTQMWKKDYAQPPTANATVNIGAMDEDSGIFTVMVKETRQWYGYNLDTGAQVWGPTASQPQYDMYDMRSAGEGNIAYGKLFSVGYSGVVHAYDIKTGVLLWNSSLNPGGLEGPYPNWPAASTYIADHKVYITTGEHSHTQPLLRGWTIYCFDADTGKNLWNITSLASAMSIADGYLINYDNMDNQIYCFGKGQTATTVTTEPVINSAAQVLIQGTVTDQSPGAKGTPAISDNDMTAWMEYLYHQRSKPTDAKGVEVSLDTLDPNGNYVHIANTTSDINGLYSYVFTPEVPGKFTIIATFGGSNSYFMSHAETAMAYDLPAATVAPTLTPTSVADTYFVPAIAGLFVLIIVVAIVLALIMLRKRL